MVNYDSNDKGVGVNYNFAGSVKGLYWKTKEDNERIKEIIQNYNLYRGKHCASDGGPLRNPYQDKKAEGEHILYEIQNLLGKATNKFKDLICGEDIIISSKNPNNKDLLESFEWFDIIQEALIYQSYAGYCGLQAFITEKSVNIRVIEPECLFLDFDKYGGVQKITKKIFFEVEINKKIKELLYQEEHFKGYYLISFFEVSGDEIIKKLDLSLLKEYCNIDLVIEREETGLDDFLISIVFNEKLKEKIFSDYTLSARRWQESLNNRETMINRILDVHASPRLIAPRSLAMPDEKSGKWSYNIQGREIIFVNDTGTQTLSYLTWDGQLVAAEKQRDHAIKSLCTELDIAPQLLGFHNLVGNTTAETSSKLKQMMDSTVKKAQRKRRNLENTLKKFITNILTLLNYASVDEFYMDFSEILPETKEEKLSEIVVRKQNKLEDSITAIMDLDNITEEEAKIKYDKIIAESVNEVQNPYPFYPNEADKEDKENEDVEE